MVFYKVARQSRLRALWRWLFVFAVSFGVFYPQEKVFSQVSSKDWELLCAFLPPKLLSSLLLKRTSEAQIINACKKTSDWQKKEIHWNFFEAQYKKIEQSFIFRSHWPHQPRSIEKHASMVVLQRIWHHWPCQKETVTVSEDDVKVSGASTKQSADILGYHCLLEKVRVYAREKVKSTGSTMIWNRVLAESFWMEFLFRVQDKNTVREDLKKLLEQSLIFLVRSYQQEDSGGAAKRIDILFEYAVMEPIKQQEYLSATKDYLLARLVNYDLLSNSPWTKKKFISFIYLYNEFRLFVVRLIQLIDKEEKENRLLEATLRGALFWLQEAQRLVKEMESSKALFQELKSSKQFKSHNDFIQYIGYLKREFAELAGVLGNQSPMTSRIGKSSLYVAHLRKQDFYVIRNLLKDAQLAERLLLKKQSKKMISLVEQSYEKGLRLLKDSSDDCIQHTYHYIHFLFLQQDLESSTYKAYRKIFLITRSLLWSMDASFRRVEQKLERNQQFCYERLNLNKPIAHRTMQLLPVIRKAWGIAVQQLATHANTNSLKGSLRKRAAARYELFEYVDLAYRARFYWAGKMGLLVLGVNAYQRQMALLSDPEQKDKYRVFIRRYLRRLKRPVLRVKEHTNCDLLQEYVSLPSVLRSESGVEMGALTKPSTEKLHPYALLKAWNILAKQTLGILPFSEKQLLEKVALFQKRMSELGCQPTKDTDPNELPLKRDRMDVPLFYADEAKEDTEKSRILRFLEVFFIAAYDELAHSAEYHHQHGSRRKIATEQNLFQVLDEMWGRFVAYQDKEAEQDLVHPYKELKELYGGFSVSQEMRTNRFAFLLTLLSLAYGQLGLTSVQSFHEKDAKQLFIEIQRSHQKSPRQGLLPLAKHLKAQKRFLRFVSSTYPVQFFVRLRATEPPPSSFVQALRLDVKEQSSLSRQQKNALWMANKQLKKAFWRIQAMRQRSTQSNQFTFTLHLPPLEKKAFYLFSPTYSQLPASFTLRSGLEEQVRLQNKHHLSIYKDKVVLAPWISIQKSKKSDDER